MFKLILLAALVAVCYGGIPHYKVGYGFVAAGYGPHGGHGAVAKVNAHQTGYNYGFNVQESSPHGHRYHYQSAAAPTAYGHYGHGGFGHAGGFGGGYAGGFGHGGGFY